MNLVIYASIKWVANSAILIYINNQYNLFVKLFWKLYENKSTRKYPIVVWIGNIFFLILIDNDYFIYVVNTSEQTKSSTKYKQRKFHDIQSEIKTFQMKNIHEPV